MSGVAHLLEATITSALALKPSTVYVVRVENRANRIEWHLRKCFSEFAELRERVLALIEGAATTTAASSPFATCSSSNSFDTGGSYTSTSSSNSSDSSTLASVTGCSEPVSAASSLRERLPYLFKQFPRRQLFGSRSKKVIEQRTRALNLFVHQLLLYVREVKQQHQIAVYFSLMSFVEGFFECAEHTTSVAANNFFSLNTFNLNSPSTLARTQAAAAAAARAAVVVVRAHGAQRRPARAPFSFSDDGDDDKDTSNINEDKFSYSGSSNYGSDEDVRSDHIALAKHMNVAQRFYQEYGKASATTTTPQSSNTTDDDDADVSKPAGLKKTTSCIAHRELTEMKMHFTASHYAPLQTVAESRRPELGSSDAAPLAVSPTTAWAARIEIAGISSAAAAVAAAARGASALPNNSKLAIGANHMQQYPHHPHHSSNWKKVPLNNALRWRSDENHHHQHLPQTASIVYAAPSHQGAVAARTKTFALDKHQHQHQQTSSSKPHSRALLQRAAARAERPEWT